MTQAAFAEELPTESAASSIQAAELNGDIFPDLFIASRVTFEIRVFLGRRGGAFEPALTATAPFAGSPAIADIDGDMDADLVVASVDTAALIVFRNHGDGTFADQENAPLPFTPRQAIPVLRGEPGGDAIYVCGDDVTMSSLVYLGGARPAIEPLDIAFSFDDLAQTLSAFGTSSQPYTGGDVTGDGFVGMDDVNVVVENIGGSAPPPSDGRWCDDNNFEIPECGGFARRWEGVQECLRAALCRSTTCHWAACIGLRSGGTLAWWIGQEFACGAVTDLELAACLAAVVPGV